VLATAAVWPLPGPETRPAFIALWRKPEANLVSLDVCSVRWAGRQAVITLPAEIDMNNADLVNAELAQALEEGPGVLVVDMTATAFCSSGGIHVLSRARSQATVAGARLRVAVTAHIVRRVLELTGMDELIDIYPDVETALAGRPVPVDRGGEGASSNGRRIADVQRGTVAD
jgi:anti-anti-sigma factor